MVKTVMVDWELYRRRPLLKKSGADLGKSVKTFIQARTTSSRFPRKIYEQVGGTSILNNVINRAREAKLTGDIVVVSPHAVDLPPGVKGFIFKRNEKDVLSRYAFALEEFPCDYVVRLTSDCPLLDPFLVDFVISNSIGYDYGSNVLVCTFPDGMDVEVMSADTLRKLNDQASSDFDREHVTTYIRNNPSVQKTMALVDVQSFEDYSPVKISVDTREDLEFVRDFASKVRR